MPRWRKKRDDAPEEIEGREELLEDLSELSAEEHLPEVDPDASIDPPPEGEEEWPEWAYGDRPSRRSRRSRSRKRGRRRRKESAPEETPETEVVDDPPLEVYDAEEPIAEPEREEEPSEADVPVWVSEDAQRLRDVTEPVPDTDAEPDELPYDPLTDPLPPPYAAGDAEGEDGSDYEATEHWDDTDGADGDLEDEYEEEERFAPQPVVGDVLPGSVGPRRAALHERKRKQRRTNAIVALAVVVAAIVGLSALSGGGGDDDEDDDRNTAVAGGEQEDSVETMLLYGTSEDRPAAGADWLALLSVDAKENRGSVVYIPAHTAVEVPGRGLLPLGEAAVDDEALLLVTTESLLGIDIDRYLELSDRDARVLFDRLGPMEVDVPTEVSVPAGTGQTRLVFTEGPQELDAEELEQLLFVTGVEGDDVELGSRHLAFWDALFESFGNRSEELEQAIRESGDVLSESDRSADENADMLGDLAAFPENSMMLNSLPVDQVSVGRGELYSVDEEAIQQFVSDTIGADSSVGEETRIQILNGNGVPGIGDDVAERLVGEGYRVILSGNARRLDYGKTLIITYERTDEGIALAEKAKELLGVGEVQVSAQEQGIVDLTIVVGKDFLERT